MQEQEIFDVCCRPSMKTNPEARLYCRICAFVVFAIAAPIVCLTFPAQASSVDAANLVTNGNFDDVTGSLGPTGASQVGLTPPCFSPAANCGAAFPANVHGTLPSGRLFPLATNWTADTGLVFMFSGNGSIAAQDGNGAEFQFSGGDTLTFQLWSTTNCAAEGCNGNEVAVPAACNLAGCGGNFIAMDGDAGNAGVPGKTGVFQGSISQTIKGLVAGDKYNVTFFTASGQQSPVEGPTETQLAVSLCGQGQSAPGPGTTIQNAGFNGDCTFFTGARANPSHGFQAWEKVVLTFTASSASETLNFLAIGSPVSGPGLTSLPPVVLLDGISVNVVPEPTTWSLIGIGFAAITFVAYRRSQWVGVPD